MKKRNNPDSAPPVYPNRNANFVLYPPFSSLLLLDQRQAGGEQAEEGLRQPVAEGGEALQLRREMNICMPSLGCF